MSAITQTPPPHRFHFVQCIFQLRVAQVVEKLQTVNAQHPGNGYGGRLYTASADREQLLVSAWDDFLNLPLVDNWVTPYLGLGTGMSQLSLGGESDAALLLQLGASLVFGMTEHLGIDLQARYFVPDEFHFSQGSTKYSMDFGGNGYTVGLRFTF